MKSVTGARDAEQRVWAIAAGQYGLVTRAQMIRAGIGPDGVRRRVRCGRLRPLHRGVYAVGPVLHPRAREMAALLACGEGAVISHRSAAALWELCPAREGEVHVTTPDAQRGHRPGIRPYRTGRLLPDEHTSLDGIPVTSPARTLLDLASQARGRELERAAARALRSGLVDHKAMTDQLRRHPRRAGAGMLRALLAAGTDPALTRSKAEELFLDLIRRGRLEPPEVNATITGMEVDFLWRGRGFAVEVDGFTFHSTRARFESDRERDVALAVEGVQVIRITWRQLVSEPEAVLARVAQAMVARAGRAGPRST